MKRLVLAALLASSVFAQTRVCQKFDKQANTFIDVPCKVQNPGKARMFWSKVGRDTREALEVLAIAGITAGYLYVQASSSGRGAGTFSARSGAPLVGANHVSPTHR